MDEKKVKPCPFCGGGTVLFRNGTRETVKCMVCGAEVSRECWAIDGAVDAWNRRAETWKAWKSCRERGIE